MLVTPVSDAMLRWPSHPYGMVSSITRQEQDCKGIPEAAARIAVRLERGRCLGLGIGVRRAFPFKGASFGANESRFTVGAAASPSTVTQGSPATAFAPLPVDWFRLSMAWLGCIFCIFFIFLIWIQYRRHYSGVDIIDSHGHIICYL